MARGVNKVILVGEVSVGNIVIVANVWELREARFKFDTEKELYSGFAKLTFPGGAGVRLRPSGGPRRGGPGFDGT